MRKIVGLMVTLLFILSILGCVGPVDEIVYDMPENGVWYCAELEVHISLDRVDGIVQPSYAIIDGDEVTCICEGEYNTPYLYLICQESSVPGFGLGDIIYWWTLMEYSEDQLVLEDYTTGTLFYFNRVP